MPIPYTPQVPGTIIDPVNLSTQLNPFGNINGAAFVSGGALYAVLYGEGSLAGTVQIAKSTTDGGSWTLLDTAHAPSADNAVFYQSGTTVYVGVQATSPGTLSFVTFNLLTGLWATSSIGVSPSVMLLSLIHISEPTRP